MGVPNLILVKGKRALVVDVAVCFESSVSTLDESTRGGSTVDLRERSKASFLRSERSMFVGSPWEHEGNGMKEMKRYWNSWECPRHGANSWPK